MFFPLRDKKTGVFFARMPDAAILMDEFFGCRLFVGREESMRNF